MKTLDDIKPGQTIGRYEFLVPIAKGGMAAVWAARLKGTRGFSKTVAIKTMLPSLSDDPSFEQMFLDEAQIAAQIHHPNVVEIMDLGEETDVLYIVMEYIDGESVATLMRNASKRKEPIGLPVGVQLAVDACNGLHAAHELKNVDGNTVGLVHRDISPQNILVTYDGMVKLVDFGVAKAAGRMSSETTAGQIKGKAPYMSPEQAMGGRVDRRTDIFAMGIVLYQLTTGKHPFRGENDLSTLHNILHRTVPSPKFVDPKFPRPLEAVIMKALSREQDKRFQTAQEMADALTRVFPPTVRRVTASDVSKFVGSLMGDAGEKRREALREAIRQADSRGSSTNEIHIPVLALNDLESGVSSAATGHVLMAPTERVQAIEMTSSGSMAALGGPQPPPPVWTGSSPDIAIPSQRSEASTGAGAAVASVEAPRPPKKVGLVIGVSIGLIAVCLVVFAGVFAAKSRASTGSSASTPEPGASVAPPAVSSAPVAAAPDAGPEASAAFDLEAVSSPVIDPSAQPVPDDNSGLNYKTPVDPNKPKGKPDGGVPKGWKPPPVTDPGF